MGSFRWILIIIGLLIIGVVYFLSTRKQTDKKLVNNRPLINSQINRDILFTEPGKTVETEIDKKAEYANEPVLDEIEEQLDVDDLDLASLFNQASSDPISEADVADQDNAAITRSPYLLNGNIVAFHIKPRQKQSLWGNDILNVLNEYNIHHGEMKVFHYKVEGENLFSILNMVEPGSFDLSRLTAQQIPGLTAIMQLNNIDKKEQSFNSMIKKLGEIADVLDASIFDSQHEILTNQTLDTIRLAVVEYAK